MRCFWRDIPLAVGITICMVTPGRSATLILDNGRETAVHQAATAPEFTGFTYGPVSALRAPSPIRHIDLRDSRESRPALPEQILSTLSMVGTARASSTRHQEVVRDYLRAHRALKDSVSLSDISGHWVAGSLTPLEEKIAAGASERLVLEIFKSLFPDEPVSVLDMLVIERESRLLLHGRGLTGEIYGVAVLTRVDGRWFLRDVGWFEGPLREDDVSPLSRLPSTLRTFEVTADNFRNWLNPPWRFNHNTLGLQRINEKFTKNSFVFVFLVEKKPQETVSQDGLHPSVSPPQLHVLWTGPRQLLPGQKVLDPKYPIDISTAHYKQGYKPNTMNLRLPRKRPKEVSFVLWYKF